MHTTLTAQIHITEQLSYYCLAHDHMVKLAKPMVHLTDASQPSSWDPTQPTCHRPHVFIQVKKNSIQNLFSRREISAASGAFFCFCWPYIWHETTYVNFKSDCALASRDSSNPSKLVHSAPVYPPSMSTMIYWRFNIYCTNKIKHEIKK